MYAAFGGGGKTMQKRIRTAYFYFWSFTVRGR